MSQPHTLAVPALFTPRDLRRQAALEAAANCLLAGGSRPEEGDYPWRREYRLVELNRLGRRVVTAPNSAPPLGADGRRLCLLLIGRLPLGRRQRLAFRLSARGHTCEQVAALLRVTPGHVRNLNRQTRLRLRAALGPAGEHLLPPREALREAYREEVARRGYVREKHCPLGQEECRGNGQCTRRWYLYFTEDQPTLPGEGE